MLKKALIHVSALGLLFLLLASSIGMGLLYYANRDLPDHSSLLNYTPPLLTRMFSSDGKLLGEHAQEKRIFIPYKHIPSSLVHAFLAAEDQNFFYHKGIDPGSIIRAAVMNILSTSKRPGGASTITQQVARNFFLSNELSVSRKLKEAILAIRIENTLPKEKILEIYLNQIFLGNRAYGVAAAGLRYFNKPLEQLTIPEVAFLAGLPKAPSTYNPKRNYDLALQRRNWVLERLWKTHLISKKDLKTYQATPITLAERNASEIVNADYFEETVRQELLENMGSNAFYREGLFIKTSLDTHLQSICDDVLDSAILRLDKTHGWRGPLKNINKVASDPENSKRWQKTIKKIRPTYLPESWEIAIVTHLEPTYVNIVTQRANGLIHIDNMKWAGAPLKNGEIGPSISSPSEALNVGDIICVAHLQNEAYSLEQIPLISGGMVVMDPHTGRVLALKGGFSFQKSQFNRATQAMRQCGSSIKPFIYLSGIENGVKPTDIYVDEPIEIDVGPGQDLWTPTNFLDQHMGEMTVRQALTSSNNIITIRVAQDAGVKNIAKLLKRLNILDNPPPYLSLALGAGETTVYRMTSAFSALANGGKKILPTVVDWVQDKDGEIIFKHDTRNNSALKSEVFDQDNIPILGDNRKQLIKPVHTYMLTSMMQSAIENSVAKTAYVPDQIVAGKSGTSNDSKDAWFLGYSANLVVGVYLGYDTPKNMGKYATGGWLAAPVFKNFMSKALEKEPKTPFKVPANAKLYRANKNTGQPTTSNDPDAIWEISENNTPQPTPQPTPENTPENTPETTPENPPKLETPGIF